MTINETVKKLMKDGKFSQKHVANELGITPAGFSKMLNRENMKIQDLHKICTVLGVSCEVHFKRGTQEVEKFEVKL